MAANRIVAGLESDLTVTRPLFHACGCPDCREATEASLLRTGAMLNGRSDAHTSSFLAPYDGRVRVISHLALGCARVCDRRRSPPRRVLRPGGIDYAVTQTADAVLPRLRFGLSSHPSRPHYRFSLPRGAAYNRHAQTRCRWARLPGPSYQRDSRYTSHNRRGHDAERRGSNGVRRGCICKCIETARSPGSRVDGPKVSLKELSLIAKCCAPRRTTSSLRVYRLPPFRSLARAPSTCACRTCAAGPCCCTS